MTFFLVILGIVVVIAVFIVGIKVAMNNKDKLAKAQSKIDSAINAAKK